MSSLSHNIRLMIEDNNHITSTNGIKMLNFLICKNSSLIPSSYPLLFLFNKFKSHKTHPINAILFGLIDTIVLTSRLSDILSAIVEGMNSQMTKANVKYGCFASFIRIASIIHEDYELFA
jgi:hypothetical protein